MGRTTLPATKPWASVTASKAWAGRVATRVYPDITDFPRTGAKVSVVKNKEKKEKKSISSVVFQRATRAYGLATSATQTQVAACARP